MPDLPAPQVAEAETKRFLLFEAVAGLLATDSQESPIVLVRRRPLGGRARAASPQASHPLGLAVLRVTLTPL